jgi:hypothetical protein
MTYTMTLQDLRDRLPELGYAPGSLPDIEKALDRAARLYGLPLHRIPAAIDPFDARWNGRVDVLALGFRSPAASGSGAAAPAARSPAPPGCARPSPTPPRPATTGSG